MNGHAEIQLRAGDPPEKLLDAAKQLDADIVALAWNQTLAPATPPSCATPSRREICRSC